MAAGGARLSIPVDGNGGWAETVTTHQGAGGKPALWRCRPRSSVRRSRSVHNDLWHSALSTWLCAGADPAEVAPGNSVEVLLTRYAKCLYDRQSLNNERMEHLLRSYDQPSEGDE